jgi:hypothetical protein
VEHDGKERPEMGLEQDGGAREDDRIGESRPPPAVLPESKIGFETGPTGRHSLVEIRPRETELDHA